MAGWGQKLGWLLRVVVIGLILAAGIGGFLWLSSLVEEPERKELTEIPVSVSVAVVKKEDVQIELTGLGAVHTPTRVAVASEVSGRLIKCHPQLVQGGIVQQGEVLFEIDPREYQLTSAAHASEGGVIDAQIAERETQRKGVEALIAARSELLEVASRQLSRTETLYKQEGVGTESEVDAAKQTVLQLREQLVQLQNTLTELPTQIETLHARRHQVELQQALDSLNLERCVVRAPITGRVQDPSIEVGERVAPGTPLAYLVDDSDRELHVSLEAAEVGRWLRFQDMSPTQSTGWFASPLPVEVEIRWLGARQSGGDVVLPAWQGTLDRIERFASDTRTVMAVVRVPAEAALSKGVPLVEGMFCEARIPGKTVKQAAVIPRTAVNDDQSVYLVENGLLSQRPVQVIHATGDKVLVGDELKEGDQVITNRLARPVFGMKVQVREPGDESMPTPVSD